MDLVKLAMAVGCPRDDLRPIDYAFIFLLPEVPQEEIAAYCATLKHVHRFCFASTGPGSGSLGAPHLQALMVAEGIDPSRLLPIPYLYPDGHVNTYFEAMSFAGYLASLNHKESHSVGFIAQSYHLLRGYMTGVSAMASRGLTVADFPAVPLTPPPVEWSKKIVHSQGIAKGTKWEIFHGELERISRYQAKGDILAASQILDWWEASAIGHI